ncbi:MAG TPA: GGDEF domain-containing protein [Candidatus Aquilonibacter sp.]|nr:GGDEF domain-containing protein [Candidatus Aquilonibacter sp.]
MDRATEGIAFLTERIDAIERERDDLLVKSQRLELLQRSFVDIIAARDERTLAASAMRGAWLGLGFSRAIWFRIDAPLELTAALELDGDRVADSEYGGTLPKTSSLFRVLSGDSDVLTGWAGDTDAPLFDTRRRYAAAAVRPQSGESFILYVDGSNERSASAWSVASLQELATHATFALERLRMAGELERLAMRDPLTGLLNRRALMERLAGEFATMRRTQERLAFAMIDVDNFKQINDTRGHAGGDHALNVIATILENETRETDIAARFAGDEFSLIMPRSDEDAVAAIMARIYAALDAVSLSCSIGVAFANANDQEETLIARADDGVYAAKAAGKGCYRIAAESA